MTPIRIAIAEDHPTLRKTMVFLLSTEERIDITVQAEHGQDLLDKLETDKVDVVILDIRMPVMDGIDTLKVLKLKYPEIKVIMFSSLSDSYMVNQTKNMGANSFVSKGTPDILADTIYEVFENEVSYNSIFLPESQ